MNISPDPDGVNGTATGRRRGRPRKGTRPDTRHRILTAATDVFAQHGYDGATTKDIAARAGVDPALIHHYFGTKAELFAIVLDLPARPDVSLPQVLAGDPDHRGERIVRFVLELWEQPKARRRGLLLMRAALGNRVSPPLIAGFARREIIGRIAATIDAPDRDLRASLVFSQIAGVVLSRHVLAIPEIAGASVDDLVARVGPQVQAILDGASA